MNCIVYFARGVRCELKIFMKLASDSAIVEHSPYKPKMECSHPTTGIERKWEKVIKGLLNENACKGSFTCQIKQGSFALRFFNLHARLAHWKWFRLRSFDNRILKFCYHFKIWMRRKSKFVVKNEIHDSKETKIAYQQS